MAQGLCGVAGALGMVNQLLHLRSRRWTCHRHRDGHFFKIRRGVIDVILFGVAEVAPYIGGSVVDWNRIKWREPRQLGKQSEGDANHEILKR